MRAEAAPGRCPAYLRAIWRFSASILMRWVSPIVGAITPARFDSPNAQNWLTGWRARQRFARSKSRWQSMEKQGSRSGTGSASRKQLVNWAYRVVIFWEVLSTLPQTPRHGAIEDRSGAFHSIEATVTPVGDVNVDSPNSLIARLPVLMNQRGIAAMPGPHGSSG